MARLAKIAEAVKIEDYAARYNVLNSLFQKWAREDPAAAFEAWVNTPEAAGMGCSYLIVQGLHKAEGFEATLDRVRKIEHHVARAEAQRYIGSEIYAVSDRAASAQLLVDSLPKNELTEPLSAAVVMWRQKADIETVWSWVDSNRDKLDAGTISRLERSAAQPFFRSNPQKGIEWLLERATDESRPGHLASIAGNWAREEPNAAAEWLGTLPPGPQNDDAFETFARRISNDDPESAAHWAAAISSPKRRRQTLNHVIATWRVTDPAAAVEFEQAQTSR